MMRGLPLLLALSLTTCTTARVADKLGLAPRLTGTWVAPAYDGELRETWRLDDDGFLRQEAAYLERGDTLFQAVTKIEEIGGELILLSVVKDGTPKIFKATMRTADEIVFENPDYQHPNKVTYRFTGPAGFVRTISGTEDGQPVETAFRFVQAR